MTAGPKKYSDNKPKNMQDAIGRMAACLNHACMEFDNLMSFMRQEGIQVVPTPPAVLDRELLDKAVDGVVEPTIKTVEELTAVANKMPAIQELISVSHITELKEEPVADLTQLIEAARTRSQTSAASFLELMETTMDAAYPTSLANQDTKLSEAEVSQDIGKHTLAFIRGEKVIEKKNLRVRKFDNTRFIDMDSDKFYTEDELKNMPSDVSVTVVWGEGHEYMFGEEEPTPDVTGLHPTVGDSPDYPTEAAADTIASPTVVFDPVAHWHKHDASFLSEGRREAGATKGLHVYLAADVVDQGIGNYGLVQKENKPFLERYRDDILIVGPELAAGFKSGVYQNQLTQERQLFIRATWPANAVNKIAFVLTNIGNDYDVAYTTELGSPGAQWQTLKGENEATVHTLFDVLMMTLKNANE